MKTFKLFFPLLALIIAFSGCNKDDDEPETNIQEYAFEVTFNITDPDIYSFVAEGDAMIEITGDAYTITANYTIGNQVFEDIVIEGNLVDGEVVLENEVLVIQFEQNGVTYTETITFSITEMVFELNEVTGSGPVKIEMDPGAIVEEGTMDFIATME